MYRSVLVPLDGSPLAERALPVAAGLAEATGATLHIVVVHKWLATWTPVNPFVMDLDAIEAQARQEKESYLHGVVDDLGRNHNVSLRSALLEGSTFEQISEYVTREQVELVVMTTHGRGGFSRYWFGSTADRLLRHLPVPILLIRAHDGIAAVPELPFRTILVALDGSLVAESSLGSAEPLSQASGHSRLHLCMVVEPPHLFLPVLPQGGTLPENPAEELRRVYGADYLRRLARRYSRRGVPATAEVVTGDDPPMGILEAADRVRADVIAIATRGRSGLKRTVLGSVADKVLRRSSVPILITRPKRASSRLAPAYARAIARHQAAGAAGA